MLMLSEVVPTGANKTKLTFIQSRQIAKTYKQAVAD